MRSIDAGDSSDGQTWYLLGRCYMAQQKYRKAYDAYQQAVYRDGRNPTFWCSIGVLYYQINQYRDALDAYSRAIRLNPYLSEVWYDLGTLYESCNQISDSLDAYHRAAELDPNNKHIQQRLALLRAHAEEQAKGGGDKPNDSIEKDDHKMAGSEVVDLSNDDKAEDKEKALGPPKLQTLHPQLQPAMHAHGQLHPLRSGLHPPEAADLQDMADKFRSKLAAAKENGDKVIKTEGNGTGTRLEPIDPSRQGDLKDKGFRMEEKKETKKPLVNEAKEDESMRIDEDYDEEEDDDDYHIDYEKGRQDTDQVEKDSESNTDETKGDKESTSSPINQHSPTNSTTPRNGSKETPAAGARSATQNKDANGSKQKAGNPRRGDKEHSKVRAREHDAEAPPDKKRKDQ
jgi:tetratricopeptide (TPR) repeat protein